MKFACKLIHGGPVHVCHRPQCLSFDCTMCWSTGETKKKETWWNLKGHALHWPNKKRKNTESSWYWSMVITPSWFRHTQNIRKTIRNIRKRRNIRNSGLDLSGFPDIPDCLNIFPEFPDIPEIKWGDDHWWWYWQMGSRQHQVASLSHISDQFQNVDILYYNHVNLDPWLLSALAPSHVSVYFFQNCQVQFHLLPAKVPVWTVAKIR